MQKKILLTCIDIGQSRGKPGCRICWTSFLCAAALANEFARYLIRIVSMHQMSDFNAKMNQIRLAGALFQAPRGYLNCSPDSIAGGEGDWLPLPIELTIS